MTETPRKIIYIAGWGRSGSTLLARILGQVEAIAHLGELRTLWGDGFKMTSRCGCGTLTRDCMVWQAILNEAFGDIDNLDLAAMTQLRRQSEPRTAELLSMRFSQNKRDEVRQRSRSYRDVLKRLYDSIYRVCEVQTIVDDSLHPGYGYMLAELPDIHVHVIHLIRDARGCTYSWTKRQKAGLGSYSLRDSALGWDLRNLATETLKHHPNVHYQQVRYEDFIQAPETTVRSLLQVMGEESDRLPFQSGREVLLKPTHSAFGNDNRANTGTITLNADEVWKQKMTTSDRLKVWSLTWPLLLRYRYRF